MWSAGWLSVLWLLASSKESGQLKLQLAPCLIRHFLLSQVDQDLADLSGGPIAIIAEKSATNSPSLGTSIGKRWMKSQSPSAFSRADWRSVSIAFALSVSGAGVSGATKIPFRFLIYVLANSQSCEQSSRANR